MERFPQEMVPIMDFVVNQEYTALFGAEVAQDKRLQVRIFNLKEVSPMRNLNPEHIDTLIAVKGMIVRTSPTIPDLKQALF
eukprot:11074191-Prorocentrum_lima.AAC.1